MKTNISLLISVALSLYMGTQYYGTFNWVAYVFFSLAVFQALVIFARRLIIKTASKQKLDVALNALKKKGVDVSSFEKQDK